MNIIEYGTTFKYHSTCEYTDFLENPDPYHLGGVNGKTDFGAGFYLSNDLDSTLIWGARQALPSEGTLNVYDIDYALFELPGIYLSDEFDDILRWAVTTAFYLQLNLEGIENFYFGVLQDKYRADVEGLSSPCHWVLSRRTDDAMYSYLKDFFAMGITFEGLIEAYYELSFGDELVVKTPMAMSYIHLNYEESRHFDKSRYINQYEQFKNAKINLFQNMKMKYFVGSGGLSIKDIAEMVQRDEEWTRYVQ